MAQHQDYKYIVALRDHDNKLLNELYRKSSPGILRWVKANSGTEADAGDLFQEALVSLYHSAHREDFKLTCPIDALIFTICRNKWLSNLRRKNRDEEVRKIEQERYTPESTVESAYERYEQETLERERLDRTLAQLSEKCQKLLRLLGRGVSSSEAAERLGMNGPDTVYRRKNACLKRWRELLSGLK